MVQAKENIIEYSIRVLNNTLIHFDDLSYNDIKRRLRDIAQELDTLRKETYERNFEN